MLLLGLLLLTASGAFTGLLIADNLSGGPDYQVTVLGNDLATMDTLGIFLSGVGLALVFCLGLAMLARGRRTRYLARPVRPAGRARRAAAVEPQDEQVLAPPQERAAEQGDRDVGAPVEPTRPTRRRHLHLFGH
ncbi:hypothetical protein BX285_6531 [Streptomyces sp. 1114.5]|uniref:hypothetical protein n=1 Tax=Streptomyces sp. 1114.5 TaxID=1938830 RepID=UPI000F1560BC|nr:hypothetical protein [Streptomyces sp. 1114.5]RKT09436.1 hypothetical protein BX285_6531 [Streptomyces sp. 1114.5]